MDDDKKLLNVFKEEIDPPTMKEDIIYMTTQPGTFKIGEKVDGMRLESCFVWGTVTSVKPNEVEDSIEDVVIEVDKREYMDGLL